MPVTFGLHHASRDSEVEFFSMAGRDGVLREVNESFARLLGYTSIELVGRSILELVHPDDLHKIVEVLAALDRGASETTVESRFVQRDSRYVHLQWVVRAVLDTELWWASGRDVTEFRQLLSQRTDLRAQLDLVLDQATAAMWELDIRLGRLTWEPQVQNLLQTTQAPGTLVELAQWLHPDDSPLLDQATRSLVDAGELNLALRSAPEEARFFSLRGRVIERDWRNRPVRAVGVLLDVTTEKAMEEQLLRMIMSDGLTGGPNRRAFDQTLRSTLRASADQQRCMSVLLIDIDDFKSFNDSFGHLVGDEALCAVARILSENVRESDALVARYGGEEFAVVIPNADVDAAGAVAQRLVEAVRSIRLRQTPGRTLSVSVGTGTWDPHRGPPLRAPTLISHADQALYAAKGAGKDRYISYESFLEAQDEERSAIRKGLSSGEFELLYQPIIDVRRNSVIGVEALARWNHPVCGQLPPSQFVPLAETSELICELDRWAIENAATRLGEWKKTGKRPLSDLYIAVNTSARHVSDPQLGSHARDAIQAAGIQPHKLEIEMTETAFVESATARARLTELRSLGIGVAIDDFGTGYTSIGQLPNLPADVLKIDRSFTASTDPRHRNLVDLMINAAHAFGLKIVAEGVEDMATLEFLRSKRCDRAQGYLFAPPLTESELSDWIARRDN